MFYSDHLLADEAGNKPASFLLLKMLHVVQVLQLQIEKKFSTLSFALAATAEGDCRRLFSPQHRRQKKFPVTRCQFPVKIKTKSRSILAHKFLCVN
jgi:hypothetical protein